MKLRQVLYIVFLVIPALGYAQQESRDVRHGNKAYEKEDYVGAEVDYRKGLEKNKEAFEAHFNLGNALFKQEKYEEAIKEYEAARQYADKDTQKQANIEHNIGNAHFALQQYGNAVEDYKKALKKNPKDNDTRYNLVKALQMLSAQQNQNQEQQQQNQPQQQEQQQEDKSQDNPKQQQEEQQQKQTIDQETAEQLLQALEQDEQETQEKVKRGQSQGGRRVEKDW